MELTSLKVIKPLLGKYQAAPSKRLGQHFLINASILKIIIKAAQLTQGDTVLEIGPGIGALTKALSESAGRVIAVEKDRLMVNILHETLKDRSNVEVIHGDALLTTSYLLPTRYTVVANLPYYITAPVIRKFLEAENQPRAMVFMVQKEVAQRISAKPPHMSLLALSVQFYATVKIISYLSKKCFWPSPKVDSAIIKIIPLKSKKGVPNELLFEVVKAGFSHPRKQLVNNLATLKSLNGVTLDKYKVTTWLLKNKIHPSQRAETLTVDDWIALAKNL